MSKRERAEVQEEAREQIGFCFGVLAFLAPVSALLAGAVGVFVGSVTPLEAVISTGIVVLAFVLLVLNDRRWRPGERVVTAIVDRSAAVVARLEPVPVVGIVAYILASSIVLWYPIVLLAIVAWLL